MKFLKDVVLMTVFLVTISFIITVFYCEVGVNYLGFSKPVCKPTTYYFSLKGELDSVQCWSSAWLDSEGCLRCEQEQNGFDVPVACGNIRYYGIDKP